MEAVKEMFLRKIAKQLDSLGAHYHIVLDELELGEVVRLNKREIVNKGITEYVESFLQNMNVGDVRVVPAAQFNIDAIQSVVAYVHSRKLYPDGSCTTTRVDDAVQVLRVE